MNRRTSTTLPTAPIAIRVRRSRARRAGKTLTRISVVADPMIVGSKKNGANAPIAASGNSQPPWYTTPYAVRIGTRSKATIHDECTNVSNNFAR